MAVVLEKPEPIAVVNLRAATDLFLKQCDRDIEEALAHEAHAGVAPLREGAAAGARRFTEGTGRGGSFAAFKGE